MWVLHDSRCASNHEAKEEEKKTCRKGKAFPHIRRHRRLDNMLRRINLSAALIVLICFFLPWEQVSCGGAKDTLSGFDLARHDQFTLWLVPLLMLAVLVIGLVRRQQAKPGELGIVSIIAGGGSAFLMNQQRTRVHDAAGFISAQLTGWFWLAFISSLALIIGGVAVLLRRQRRP